MDPKQPNEKRNPDQQFPGGQKPQQNPTEKPQRDQDQQRKNY